MRALLDWNGKLNVADALQRGHDKARADIAQATIEGCRIARLTLEQSVAAYLGGPRMTSARIPA